MKPDRTIECTFTFHLHWGRNILTAEYATFTRLGVRLPCDASVNSGYAYVLMKELRSLGQYGLVEVQVSIK